MTKSNGGYDKNRKKLRFAKKTIFPEEGQLYGKIVKQNGNRRVDVEIFIDGNTRKTVVGSVAGSITKCHPKKDDYVICVPDYTGPNASVYGVIHKYFPSDYEKLKNDPNFNFGDELAKAIEEEVIDDEYMETTSRDNIYDGMDSEDEEEVDEEVNKVKFVPSLDDL